MHDILKTLRKLVIIAAVGILAGCSEYQKVLKSTNLEYKLKKAIEYYEDEKYNKAYPLFDELLTLYRGTPKAQDVYYYYAYTNYHIGDYILAAYHFKNFYKTFPGYAKAEEAAFMVGYCYNLESPPYSLDQSYTYKAINELQLFVNTHPESEKLSECNKLISELRAKLEKKSFEKAKLYYETEYYMSAVVAFNNTLNDFPDTEFREEALFLRLQSAYKLADNSIEGKKLQRFIEAQTAYFDFVETYPESPKNEKANEIYGEIQGIIKQLRNKQLEDDGSQEEQSS